MVVIKGFESTTVWKAFVLNSLAASIAIVAAIYVKSKFDTYVDDKGNKIRYISDTTGILVTFTATFIATFMSFTALHFIFGYGAGQLAINLEN